MAIAVPVTIELTEREEMFVRAAVVHGLKPTRAATIAGYSVSHARALLRKQHIRQAIRASAANANALVARFERDNQHG